MTNTRGTLSKSLAIDENYPMSRNNHSPEIPGESYLMAPELYLTAPNAGLSGQNKAFASANINLRYSSDPRNESTGDMSSPWVERGSLPVGGSGIR